MKLLSSIAVASAAAFFCSLTILLWLYGPRLLLHADGVLTRLEGVESKINATATNLDKASKQWADSEKSISTDIADTTLQARGTLSGAQDAFASIPPVAQHLQGTADAGTALLASAKQSTDALPPLIGSAKDVMEDTNLTLSSYSNAADDLDQLLKRKSIDQTLDNMAALTQNANGILVDGRKVSDKLTNDFVAPKPWWKKIGPSLEDVWDYGALVARHTP